MVIGIDCSRAFVKEKTGTENYSYAIVREILRLPESRTHQFVLFTRPEAIIPDWVRVSHADVVAIPLRYLWTQLGLAAATWQKRIDVLWIPAHTLPVFREPHLKTVVTIHGLEYIWLPEYRNLLQRWYLPLSTYYACRHADHLIAVSAFTRGQIIDELGIPSEKIEVIHEGVNSGGGYKEKNNQDEKTALAPYGLLDTRYILTVGTVQPRKNLSALIQAFSLVHKQFPNLKLVIAGARGWMTDEIYRAPLTYGVQDSVIFTGRVADQVLEELYTHAEVYVQASLQEGFGLPVFEAMTHGIPTIVSDGGALPEIVGEAAVVVPLNGTAPKLSHFPDRLSEAIIELIRDRPHRKSLAEKGKKRAATFTWRAAAQNTLRRLLS